MDPYCGNVLACRRYHLKPQTFSVFIVLRKANGPHVFPESKAEVSLTTLSLCLTPHIQLITWLY